MEQSENFRLELAIGRTLRNKGEGPRIPKCVQRSPHWPESPAGLCFLSFRRETPKSLAFARWKSFSQNGQSFISVGGRLIGSSSVVLRSFHSQLLAGDSIAELPEVWNMSCCPSVGTCEQIGQGRVSQPGGKVGRRACISLKGRHGRLSLLVGKVRRRVFSAHSLRSKV